MIRRSSAAAAVVLLLVSLVSVPASGTEGRVLDAMTGEPIEGALVTAGDVVVATDSSGAFGIEADVEALQVRAAGYVRRRLESADAAADGALSIRLAPFRAKALYLSFYGIGSSKLREDALRLIDETELNAVVIDVKGDAGKIPYASGVPLASQVGAQSPRTIRDLDALLARLRDNGIYTIARVVVFKDAPLAASRPDLAVKTRSGAIWRDREGLSWTDPFRREVWDYNVDVAVEAARRGFDEIQFDYVRFPDAPGLVFSQPSTEATRTAAIGGFLLEAKQRLASENVFVSADVFGYVCWNRNDTTIGQRLEELPPLVDYVSPMLYPSSFQFGIPGYRMSVAHPYEIVRLSLDEARERTSLSATRFRPWLQAFRDYAFDRRPFGGREIRAQIDAAEDFGAAGWMLWNPMNLYSHEAIEAE